MSAQLVVIDDNADHPSTGGNSVTSSNSGTAEENKEMVKSFVPYLQNIDVFRIDIRGIMLGRIMPYLDAEFIPEISSIIAEYVVLRVVKKTVVFDNHAFRYQAKRITSAAIPPDGDTPGLMLTPVENCSYSSDLDESGFVRTLRLLDNMTYQRDFVNMSEQTVEGERLIVSISNVEASEIGDNYRRNPSYMPLLSFVYPAPETKFTHTPHPGVFNIGEDTETVVAEEPIELRSIVRWWLPNSTVFFYRSGRNMIIGYETGSQHEVIGIKLQYYWWKFSSMPDRLDADEGTFTFDPPKCTVKK